LRLFSLYKIEMPKTRKQRQRQQRQKSSSNKHERIMSIRDIQHWYTHEFKKLGWMILANESGETEKLHCYKKSLEHLKDHIERRMKKYVDRQSKVDLEIMHNNVSVLQRHVNKDTASL
jgi:hypothetical protein